MILIKAGKLLIGVLLIPACVAVTVVFGREVFPLLFREVWFLAGLFAYLLLLGIFQQPIRTYVFGHELTHVIWVWLFGGRVKGFKAAARGGEVRTTRSNFLIFLSPYFFPLYSALAIGLYLLLNLFWKLPPSALSYLSFALGFTWAFHLTLTVYVLVQGQPDIWAAGRVFSFPFIYLVNVVILAALIIFVTPDSSSRYFFSSFWEESRAGYISLWNDGPEFCRRHYLSFRDQASAFLAGS
ncbi:MAG: hypothetical protein P9M08_03810 [Candidatus Erginobacter occultus]|nr:hypothetical protein [Candidatus Erginobacter occultus]